MALHCTLAARPSCGKQPHARIDCCPFKSVWWPAVFIILESHDLVPPPGLAHTLLLTFGLDLTFPCLRRTRFIASQKPAGPHI